MKKRWFLYTALAAALAASPSTAWAAQEDGTQTASPSDAVAQEEKAWGWKQEEDGRWYYLERSGERLTDDWIRTENGYYFYLDSDGYMVTDTIIEDGDDLYYVDVNGCRVTNQWVSRPNEDDECEQDVHTLWYYFGRHGRAERTEGKTVYIPNSSGERQKYFFDDDGHMLTGWQSITNSSGDVDTYYLGDENQGYAHLMWQYIQPDYEFMEETDEDYDGYEMFYFGWDGKMTYGEESELENEHYIFDENGVRLTGWQPGITPTDPALGINKYYDTETGIRASGWLFAYDPDSEETGDPHWFYCDEDDGLLYNEGGRDSEGEGGLSFKKIDGHTYFFDNRGRLITGLIDTENQAIDESPFTENGWEEYFGDIGKGGTKKPAGIYYLSQNESTLGQMEEDGKLTLRDGGEAYHYYISTSGKAYANALVDGCIYGADGVRIERESGWELITLEDDVYEESSFRRGDLEEDAKPVIAAGTDVAINASGKVRKDGTVKIDGVRYEISNYAAQEAEEE